MKGFAALMLSCFSLLVSSCWRSGYVPTVDPPPNPPLTRPIGYAVVTLSYTRLFDSPGGSGVALSYLRRGSVLPIVERRSIVSEYSTERWILIENTERGWLPELAVSVYNTEAAAKTAAERLSK